MSAKGPDLSKTRTFGIAAHIDAGKTTVSERILYYTGIEHRMGEVHEGNTAMDWMEEEQQRGITITAAATNCPWQGHRLQLVDTPGHVDFTAEVERSLRVLDGAIIVFDCLNGVEAQSETVWRQANKYHVPRMAFLNKLDKPGAEPAKCIDDIRRRLNANAVAIQLAIGREKEFEGVVDLVEMTEIRFPENELGSRPAVTALSDEWSESARAARVELIEKVGEVDEVIFEKYVHGTEIDAPTLRAAIRRATIKNAFVPVMMGAAFRNKGVQPLLDAIVHYLPSPIDLPPVKGFEPQTEKEVLRKPDPSDAFAALVFKIFGDAHGDLTYIRIYSGTLKSADLLYNARTGKPERANRIFRMHANDKQQIDSACAGDIVAIPGLKETVTGDTLFERGKPVALERSQFPEPVISMALEPKSSTDRDKLLESLKRLEREDPTFRARTDAESGQVIIAGMGELHLEVLSHRLEREYRVPTNAGKPFVSYRETIQKEAKAAHVFERELGGRKLYASATVIVRPGQDTKPRVIINNNILTSPIGLLRAACRGIQQSVEDGAQSGANFGFPMVNIEIEVAEIVWTAESTEVAAQAAASEAFAAAVSAGGGELLEPILRFEIRTPGEFLSGVLNDLQGRRGVVEDLTIEENVKVVRGTIPAGETFGYTTALRSLSQGRATAALEPSRYAAVPDKIRREVTGS
ncbi:MAG: elongation factor G [Planctomycetes bacterium]|nr:elongation factor G [Planctomycetota bacterium]